MANICSNVMTIKGQRKDVEQFMEEIANGKILFDFNKIVPVPDDTDWREVVNKYWGCTGAPDEYKVERTVFDENMFGEITVKYIFDTKWTAPFLIYEELADRFRNVSIAAVALEIGCNYYYEGDNGDGKDGIWYGKCRDTKEAVYTREAKMAAWAEYLEDPKMIKDWNGLLSDKDVWYDVVNLDTDRPPELSICVDCDFSPDEAAKKYLTAVEKIANGAECAGTSAKK